LGELNPRNTKGGVLGTPSTPLSPWEAHVFVEDQALGAHGERDGTAGQNQARLASQKHVDGAGLRILVGLGVADEPLPHVRPVLLGAAGGGGRGVAERVPGVAALRRVVAERRVQRAEGIGARRPAGRPAQAHQRQLVPVVSVSGPEMKKSRCWYIAEMS
jgi:hypothetical protein